MNKELGGYGVIVTTHNIEKVTDSVSRAYDLNRLIIDKHKHIIENGQGILWYIP